MCLAVAAACSWSDSALQLSRKVSRLPACYVPARRRLQAAGDARPCLDDVQEALVGACLPQISVAHSSRVAVWMVLRSSPALSSGGTALIRGMAAMHAKPVHSVQAAGKMREVEGSVCVAACSCCWALAAAVYSRSSCKVTAAVLCCFADCPCKCCSPRKAHLRRKGHVWSDARSSHVSLNGCCGGRVAAALEACGRQVEQVREAEGQPHAVEAQQLQCTAALRQLLQRGAHSAQCELHACCSS